jgi:hypothetical protein
VIAPTDAPGILIAEPEDPQGRKLWELAIRKWRRAGPRGPETHAEWGQVVAEYNALRRKLYGPLATVVSQVREHG